MHGDTEGVPSGNPVLDEKVGVLEVVEDAEGDGDGDPEPSFLLLPVIALLDADADELIDEG